MVGSIFIQSRQLGQAEWHTGLGQHPIKAEDGLLLVWRYYHPGCFIASKWILDTVESAILNQLAVLLHKLNLFLYLLKFLWRQTAQIQLIAEAAEVSHIPTEFQAGISEYLMIWGNGNVRANKGQRIAVAGAILNEETLAGIAIVTCPRLRCIVEHAWVKTTAT